jgi:uncharacterized membrane protein YgdD (TMEM256/DUF423 family)
MNNKLLIQLTALMGVFAVGIGAFGAHGLADILETTGRTATFETGVKYHIYHTLAMFLVVLGLILKPGIKHLYTAFWSFFTGIIIFSGSLYVLSLTGLSYLGAITPIGGVAFILGWIFLFLAAKPLSEK